MKKYLVTILAAMAIMPTFAQLNGDGYYRIQNAITERYAYVIDDRGSLNMSSTSADLRAISLWKGFEKASSDASTLFYIKSVGSQYDMTGQGTGVHDIIGLYFNIRTNSDGTYYAYGTYSGIAKYLGDNEYSSSQDGNLTSEGQGEYRKWYIKPVNESEGNYFGFLPTISDETSNYLSFYADFGYVPSSKGTKSYYVSTIYKDMAVLKEITSDVVPSSTPVIVKCESLKVADNKAMPTKQTASKPSDNKLIGVYFNNNSNSHNNQVAYNPATMRVLGMMSNGKVGFVKSDIKFIPSNSAYLSVPSGTPDELRLVSEAEYTAGVENVYIDSVVNSAVYSLSGVKVAETNDNLSNLPAGVYIVGGKKIVVQ